MTTESISMALHDVRTGHFDTRGKEEPLVRAAQAFAMAGPVVDISGIYRTVRDRDYSIDLYESHTSVAPPWLLFTMAFVNKFGNVFLLPSFVKEEKDGFDGPSWTQGEDIDWSDVRWTIDTFVFISGKTHGRGIPTTGPCFLFQTAIHKDGRPVDLHWVDLMPDIDRDLWDMSHQTMLGALNFLNCRNVDIVEVQQPRPERRRLQRLGAETKLHTINVFPAGKTTRNTKGEPVGGTPLTPVRGHFAEYGEAYGKGKLFGRLEGRFWVPAFVRGARENGEVISDYKLHPTA